MGSQHLMTMLVLLALLLGAAGATAQNATVSNPLGGGCTAGAAYDPACDVNRDGVMDINDLQLTAAHWNQTGTWTGDNNHDHLGQTWTGNDSPLTIQGSYSAYPAAPLVLSNDTGYGLRVTSAGASGVLVSSAATWGVLVSSAGNDGLYVGSAGGSGLSVYSAGGDGVYVDAADGDGFYLGQAGNHGVVVDSSTYNGVRVVSAGNHGVRVLSAVNTGMTVDSAGGHGVRVDSAAKDGVHVDGAGAPSAQIISTANNGFEVEGAEGYGLYVGRADVDGVLVSSAGDDGVVVAAAGFTGVYANTTDPAGYWGVDTPDRIRGSNVTLQSLSLIAQVSGPGHLNAGDLVAAAGLADPLPGSTLHIPQVRPADGTFSSALGVVERRLDLTSRADRSQRDASAGDRAGEAVELRGADGPAQPGDYVAITVLGAAQVRVDADAAIAAGQRLTPSATPGRVRALHTFKVPLADGSGTVDMLETTPAIGVALEDHVPGRELIWVLVNLR